MLKAAVKLSYWTWLFKGLGGKPGWRKFLDRWLLLHVAVGTLFAILTDIKLGDAANSVLLPLAGVFVGLSFAWAGNAQALLQTTEAEALASQHVGGFEEYVFTFQSAILTILVTLIVWGAAGLRLFEGQCLWPCPAWLYPATRGMLFFLASLTVRECWHVVLGAQWMLLAQRELKLQRRANRTAERDDV